MYRSHGGRRERGREKRYLYLYVIELACLLFFPSTSTMQSKAPLPAPVPVCTSQSASGVSTQVFNNQLACQHTGCANLAHFSVQGPRYVCGVHSRKVVREKLRNLPTATLKRQREAREAQMEEEQERCRQSVGVGQIRLIRLQQRRAPKIPEGFCPISPNAMGGQFTGSWAMLTLSPMKMGPIPTEMHHEGKGAHALKEVPLLENLHQMRKAFAGEAKQENGKWVPTETYWAGFETAVYSNVPQRHKASSHKKNEPLCSFWALPSGELEAVDYITSRARYCALYALFADKSEDESEFLTLRKWHDSGYHLAICGFDAFDLPTRESYKTDEAFADELLKVYENREHPYGHERVLYTMLLLENKALWPWNRGVHAETLKRHGYAVPDPT